MCVWGGIQHGKKEAKRNVEKSYGLGRLQIWALGSLGIRMKQGVGWDGRGRREQMEWSSILHSLDLQNKGFSLLAVFNTLCSPLYTCGIAEQRL
jgi:hypothetical protein